MLDKLKLDRDFSRYNYLSLDSAQVNGVDDAANFRTVRVRIGTLLPSSVLVRPKFESFHFHLQLSYFAPFLNDEEPSLKLPQCLEEQ